MNRFKKQNTRLAKFTGALAALFAVLLVVSPAFAANAHQSNTLAFSIILPALGLCSAIIFGVWRQMAQTKRAPIPVRKSRR